MPSLLLREESFSVVADFICLGVAGHTSSRADVDPNAMDVREQSRR